MSTHVKISVARRGNVVVSLLRLEVQLRVIFATVACCWYFTRASDWMTPVERRRLRNPGSTAGHGFNPAGGASGGFQQPLWSVRAFCESVSVSWITADRGPASGSARVEFCGFCGGKHPSTQCVGVQGSSNLCGQYGHFARVCPSAGSQLAAAQPQGRGGLSRGRSP
ncbi:hypothetical protein F511_35853 [Dorcoceras hygrometricum]|uniref:CCHC-type domain-containing protein n=1 Tax=Dorcoceras hygrometricum TaxID=472368 RepID=A0A2Z7CII8_9LAMI|nr:hypothetical protein F511_35853 [Dorcoceras hygrometricum]